MGRGRGTRVLSSARTTPLHQQSHTQSFNSTHDLGPFLRRSRGVLGIFSLRSGNRTTLERTPLAEFRATRTPGVVTKVDTLNYTPSVAALVAHMGRGPAEFDNTIGFLLSPIGLQ